MLAEAVTALPAASDTEKVTTVTPIGYSVKPSLVILAVKSPSLLSVATAAAKKAATASLLDATTCPGISTLTVIDSEIESSGSTISTSVPRPRVAAEPENVYPVAVEEAVRLI